MIGMGVLFTMRTAKSAPTRERRRGLHVHANKSRLVAKCIELKIALGSKAKNILEDKQQDTSKYVLKWSLRLEGIE